MRHFEQQLDDLRTRLLEMSGLVESAIYRSVVALTEKDEQQAMQAFQNESRINQMEIEIDDIATGLLALEQPVALICDLSLPPSRSITTWSAWEITPLTSRSAPFP